jgi:hypothetical protein
LISKTNEVSFILLSPPTGWSSDRVAFGFRRTPGLRSPLHHVLPSVARRNGPIAGAAAFRAFASPPARQ